MARSSIRLNQRAGAMPPPCPRGLSSVAQSAGVRISATASDSTMTEMMVTENCR